MAGRRIKGLASHAQAFRKMAGFSPRPAWVTGFRRLSADNPVSAALARITRRRAVLADRLHHLPMPALFPFHMDRDHRMRRGHQQQDVKNQPENHAKHDQEQVENRRKRLPFSNNPSGGSSTDTT